MDIATLGIKVTTQGVRDASRDLQDLESQGRRTEDSTKGVSSAFGALKAAIATLGVGVAVREFVQAADQMSLLDARLRLSTASAQEFASAQRQLFGLAQQNSVGLAETIQLYTRLADPIKRVGGGINEVIGITDTFQKALQLGGVSAAEAAAATLQFGQALGRGALSGDEFNSIAEASPRILKAIAEGAGLPIEKLKELGSEGKLTSDVIGNALLKVRGQVTQEFATLPDTVGNAMTRMKNDFLALANDVNKSGNFTAGIADGLDAMRELIPPIRDELVEAAREYASWWERNSAEMGVVLDHVTGIAGVAWDLAGVAARVAGTLAEWALQSGAVGTVLETVHVLAVNIAYVFDQIGNELGGMAAQAAALMRLDFDGFAAIGEAMREDAAKARAEVDALSERILAARKSALDAGTSIAGMASEAAKAEQPFKRLAASTGGADKAAKAARNSADEYAKHLRDLLAKDLAAAAKAQDDLTQRYAAALGPLEDHALQLERELATYGQTEAQIAATTAQRYAEVRVLAEANGASADYLRTLDLEIAARKRIAEASAGLESRRATTDAAQAAATEWQRTADSIENSLTDALMRGFENGEGFGENFRDTLINMFKTLVLRPIIAPIAQGMAGGVMQMMGMSPGGGAGGMNLTGMASNAYNLYNNASIGYQFMTGGMSGANALGTMYANATGTGLDGLLATNGAYGTAAPAAGGMGATMAGWGGAGLGAYAGYQLTGGNLGGAALGGVAGYGAASGIASGTGAYAGMTASLSAIPVWGWAAIAALAIYSMTSKGGTPHVGSAVLTGLDDSQEHLRHKQAVGDTVVWGGFKEGDGFTEPLKGLGKGVADTIEAALKDFGAGGSVSVYSAFGADGDDQSRGNLRIYDEAGNLLAANSDQEKRGKKYADDPKKGFEQFVADSGRVIRDALVAADLPAWVDEVLSSLGEGPSADAVNTTLQQINDVKDLAALAGPALGLTAEGLAGVISASGDFTGTMNGIAAILGTTVDANDRWRMAQESLQKAFDAAGATLPNSTEGFRAMLRGIDLTTDAGQSLYAGLLDLAPAFWEVASAVEAAFEQISKTTAGTIEAFKFDVMDAEAKYAFYDTRITDTLAQLADAIDPSKVLELFNAANADLSNAWKLLDDAQKQSLVGQFEDRALELESLSQARLSVAPLDSPQQVAENVATAVSKAVTDALTVVADTMAKAGGDQAAAAEMLAGAIAQIPARIVVEVDAAEVGGMGWR